MNCEICGKQISGTFKIHASCAVRLEKLKNTCPFSKARFSKNLNRSMKRQFSVESGIAKKDISHEIKSALLLFKGREALGVSGSACVDLSGFKTANILLNLRGTGAALSPKNNVKITILHGDTSTGATGAVASEYLSGATSLNGVVKNFSTAPTGAAKDSRIGYTGGKRYIRVRYDASGSASAATGANGIRMVTTVVKANSPKDLFQENIIFIEKEKAEKINNMFST